MQYFSKSIKIQFSIPELGWSQNITRGPLSVIICFVFKYKATLEFCIGGISSLVWAELS